MSDSLFHTIILTSNAKCSTEIPSFSFPRNTDLAPVLPSRANFPYSRECEAAKVHNPTGQREPTVKRYGLNCTIRYGTGRLFRSLLKPVAVPSAYKGIVNGDAAIRQHLFRRLLIHNKPRPPFPSPVKTILLLAQKLKIKYGSLFMFCFALHFPGEHLDDSRFNPAWSAARLVQGCRERFQHLVQVSAAVFSLYVNPEENCRKCEKMSRLLTNQSPGDRKANQTRICRDLKRCLPPQPAQAPQKLPRARV